MKMEEGSKRKFNKEKLTEQLNRRHKERQVNLDNIHELKCKETSELEGINYFDNVFDEKEEEINYNLKNLETSDVGQLAASFNKIGNLIQELQKYVSSSTLFLTDYKIKTCQNVINDITIKTEESKNKLIPKKKFGFRAKPISTTVGNKLSKNVIKKNQDNIDNKIEEKKFEWTLSQIANRVINLDGVSVNNKDITFSGLDNCLINIQGHPGMLQLSNLKNSTILCGPVARSIFADNCINCKFAFACQQMRLHSSKSCDIFLHVTCRCIMEDCSDINVAPYNFIYSNIDNDFVKSGLDSTINNWTDVADFNWLSPDKPSPNWRKMNETNIINDWYKYTEIFCKTL